MCNRTCDRSGSGCVARVVALLLLLLAVPGSARVAEMPAPPDDGLTADERWSVDAQVRDGQARGADVDIIIADTTRTNVYFGLYRTSQMTDPGWALFEDSLDHVNSFRDRTTTKVWLATYNGTLDDQYSAERDGIAVYNRMVNVMGFTAANIRVAHQSTIETGDFTGYDIVVYSWIFDRNAQNVLNQGKPFLTFAAGETDEMGIGSGATLLHESRNFAYVLTDQHAITSGWTVGRFTLAGSMFMEATTASGNGVTLVSADSRIPCTDLQRFKVTCRRGKLKSVVVFTSDAHDARQIALSVSPEPGEANATINGDRAKHVLKHRLGDYSVELLYPEDCVDAQTATCQWPVASVDGASSRQRSHNPVQSARGPARSAGFGQDMARRFLVTAALPYSNGRLHVGHIAGAYLPADIYVRYLRATGADVRFICGSDDNGVAALKTAREEGRPVEELTAHYNASQRRSFAGLGIRFDVYGGTHQPDYVRIHERFSQEFFRKIYDKGLFTKRTSRQLYDVQAEQFLPDRFVKGTCPHCKSENAFGDQCEGCGRTLEQTSLINPVSVMTGTKPELRETKHWYLRLDQLQSRLAAWLASKKDPAVCGAHWRPVVINQSLGRIETEGLPERAMTRDLTWGVPVPLADPDAQGKSLYVWFDAPIGYVSFTAALLKRASSASSPLPSGGGQGEGLSPESKEHAPDSSLQSLVSRWWLDPDCKVVHFIGEDNIVFHAITWPAMMLATHDSDNAQGARGEYQLPHNVVANCFLNIKFPGKEEEKISKSRGTAVWIEEYLQQFAPDPLRYYLTAIAPEAQRTAFELEDFIARNNGELGNALGNFFNRCITFAHKYFEGRVPPAGQRDDADRAQLARCRDAVEKVAAELEACHFKAALGEVMSLARAGNLYFDQTKPFLSRKTDMPACARAINICLQTARTLTTLMAPFLPDSAQKAAKMLGLTDFETWSKATQELPEAQPLREANVLFPRIEIG